MSSDFNLGTFIYQTNTLKISALYSLYFFVYRTSKFTPILRGWRKWPRCHVQRVVAQKLDNLMPWNWLGHENLWDTTGKQENIWLTYTLKIFKGVSKCPNPLKTVFLPIFQRMKKFIPHAIKLCFIIFLDGLICVLIWETPRKYILSKQICIKIFLGGHPFKKWKSGPILTPWYRKRIRKSA